MAKKKLTNGDKVKALVKDLANTPHEIGLAIMRGSLLTSAEEGLKSIEENPKSWENPIISVGMYKDYFNRVIEALKFEDQWKVKN